MKKGILIIRDIDKATQISGYTCRLYASGDRHTDEEESLRYINSLKPEEKYKKQDVEVEL